MSYPLKRGLSIVAIVIASVAAGMILTADLGWTRKSEAQQAIRTDQGVVPAVTIPSFADVAARVMPAVVSITTEEIVRTRRFRGLDPFDFFFPPDQRNPGRPEQDEDQGEERLQRSGGSGFIISPDGYILTNNHVVEGATRVTVHYGEDDRTAQAKVVGRDPATDIALLKIDLRDPLPTVRLGDSTTIRVGDWAIAIGNPLGMSNTLTVGVISAKGRQIGISEATSSFENFIQTDAAINFGNSGGPLLNINGEVIGINTAIRSYAQNIGFATPVNTAKVIYPQLKDKGKVVRGYLGIRIDEIDEREQQAFGLSSRDGVLVQDVEPGKPADKAGVRRGDIVVRVDEVPVQDTRDLIDYVSSKPPGSTVRLQIIRDGDRRTINVRTEERPPIGIDEETSTSPEPARDRLGISAQPLTPSSRQRYGIADDVDGLLVINVKEVSPAGEAGLAEGDVIREVNGQRVTTVEQLREIVDRARPGQYLRLYVTRPGRGDRSLSRFIIVQIP
jgi:serine protease Do